MLSTRKGLLFIFLVLAALNTPTINGQYLAPPEITGNEVVLIESERITLETPLIFKDNTTLMVVNGELVLGNSSELYLSWPYLNFTDSSRLIIINSTITGNPDAGSTIYMNKGTHLEMINMESEQVVHPYSGVYKPRFMLENASARIAGSDIYSLGIGGDSKVEIWDSEISRFAAATDTPVMIINSTIGQVHLVYHHKTLQFNKTYIGFYEYLDASTITPEPNYQQNFVMINSTLQKAPRLTMGSCDAVIMDCDFSIVTTDSNMTLTISNATISELWCSERDTLNLTVSDSHIGELRTWMDDSNITLTESTFGVVSASAFGRIKLTIQRCDIDEFVNYETKTEDYHITDTKISTLNMVQYNPAGFNFENVTLTNLKNGRKAGHIRVNLKDIFFTESPSLVIGLENTLDVVRRYRIQVTENKRPNPDIPIRTSKGSTPEGYTDENGEYTLTVHYSKLTNTTKPPKYTIWVDETPIELTLFTDSPIMISTIVETPERVLIGVLICVLGTMAVIFSIILRKIGF